MERYAETTKQTYEGWEEFYSKPVDAKLDFFKQKDRIFDVIFAQQFDRPFLKELCELADKIRLLAKTKMGAQKLSNLLPHKRAMLGVGRTFQGVQLFPGLTVIDNLLTGRHIHMKTNPLQGFLYRPWTHREEMRERRKVEEIIDFLEVKHIRHRIVGSLSYGLRKRIDLGRALAMEPKVLLMDEPMAGMNLEEKEDMARFIIDIREAMDIPIVIVEHDMQVVMDIADRIYVLNWGHVIAEGSPEEIKRNPDVIQAYLGKERGR